MFFSFNQTLLLWTEYLCSPKINEAISPKMLVSGRPVGGTKGEIGHEGAVSIMELVAL